MARLPAHVFNLMTIGIQDRQSHHLKKVNIGHHLPKIGERTLTVGTTFPELMTTAVFIEIVHAGLVVVVVVMSGDISNKAETTRHMK
jgi:hypothetical protein